MCAAVLCASAAADARDRARPSSAHNPAITGIGRVTPGRALPVAAQAPRIRFTNEGIVRQDGTPGDRRAVVGSIPLVGPLAAEVGLFSVTAATPKEREMKRGDVVTDVQPRRGKVAAVGLRMRF